MGLAASQARLLSLTARIHDVEYQAQMIQNAKIQLATQEDAVYKKYTDALDATTLTFTNDSGNLIPANFNNLCGLASIDNGLFKNYVFRTGDNDRLIVPSEVYDGYVDLYGKDGCGDPYEFALVMLGLKEEDISDAEDKYISNRDDGNSSDPLVQLRENMEDKLRAIAKITGDDPDGLIKDTIKGGQTLSLVTENYPDAEKLEDEYEELNEKYRAKLYNSGAEYIYEIANDGDVTGFDQNKFNYYLRWGKLIEQEVGIRFCVSESDYSDTFGSDSDVLNEMLQSGRITVDVVSVDAKSGELSDDKTSVSSDSNLAYTATSTIDKTALARAEAEYEYEMKKIDKQDKLYDMDLNKLETERTALTTEYDSVKKVIQDNIERTFGIFS